MVKGWSPVASITRSNNGGGSGSKDHPHRQAQRKERLGKGGAHLAGHGLAYWAQQRALLSVVVIKLSVVLKGTDCKRTISSVLVLRLTLLAPLSNCL